LVQAFRDSIDDYLAFCNERGEEPERPWSGRFVVRISPELHLMAAEAAAKADQSLNAWVKAAIAVAVGGSRFTAVPLLSSSVSAGAGEQSKPTHSRKLGKSRKGIKSRHGEVRQKR